jgi:hypothetical protein
MTKIGNAEGIEHGTPRGYWQHSRRHVPACPPCVEAFTTHREAAGRDADVGRTHTFNSHAVSKPVGARAVVAARESTPLERRRAARLLAAAAAGRDDLRDLLAAVNLTAADGLADIPDNPEVAALLAAAEPTANPYSTSGDC